MTASRYQSQCCFGSALSWPLRCLFRNGRALSWQPDGFFAGKPLGIEELILALRQFEKMPPGLVLGLDDPHVGIERDLLLQALFDLAFFDGLLR